MPTVNNPQSELLYGKKLVTLLRRKATAIYNREKTASYNDTAKCIFAKTGYSCSGSHLSRISVLELEIKAELRNACAIFLEIPVESIELAPPHLLPHYCAKNKSGRERA